MRTKVETDPKSPVGGTFLNVVESLIVGALGIAVTLLTILTFLWVVWNCSLQTEQARLEHVLSVLNSNWKALLILLVPLFYRTLRGFIGRLKKGPWGMEADPENEVPKSEAPKAERNPSPMGAE